MNEGKSCLNPSSLLDLKAELHKKYESFQRAKLSQRSESPRSTSFKCKDQKVLKEKKAIPKVTVKVSEESSEEELALKKSQLALEAKAKLYEKITSNKILIDDEESEKYLVDFQRKVLYDTPVNDKNENTESKPPAVLEKDAASTYSSDSFKEIYHKKPMGSDKYESLKVEDNQTDQPVHYQNVQFNEIRDHGTGYFAFSMDESKRKEQMEELKKLHKQTEEQRLLTQRLQRKRKSMLEARLAKVCERRNIDKSVVQTYTKTQETPADQDQVVDLSSIPLPETPEIPEKKEVKIRPWDIGKTNFIPFVPEKQKIRSQTNWIEDKRSERPSEFAPPSSYR